jgi:ABC-type glycerol-3-phosphate transport system substrate-binding protein
LIDVAEAITAKVANTAGCMFCTSLTDPRGAQEWLSFYLQLNKHLFALDPATKKWVLNGTTAQFTKVFELYYAMYFGSKANPAIGSQSGAAGISSYVQDPGYVSGLWAMVPMGPWILARQTQSMLAKQILQEDTGIASMPLAAGGTPGTYLEIKPWMLNSHSKNPAAAWELMEFLGGKAFNAKFVAADGFASPRYDVLKDPVTTGNWWVKDFAKLLPEGVALDPLNWAPVYTAILTQMQAVVFGQSSPSQAAAALANQLKGFASQGIL